MACKIEDIYNEIIAEENITDTKSKNEVINNIITAIDVKGSTTNEDYSPTSMLNEYTIKLGNDDFTKAFNDAYKVDVSKGVISDQVEFIQHAREVVSFMSSHFYEYAPEVEVKVEEAIVNNGTRGYNNLNEDTITIMYDEKDLTSSKSEILLHETLHRLAKDAKNTNTTLFRDLETIREMAKDKIPYEVFLDQIRLVENRNQFTDTEIQRAKAKLDYIMNEDIEEFFAYAVSNQSLHNMLKTVNVKELAEITPEVKSAFTPIKDKTVVEVLLDAFKDLFGFNQPLSDTKDTDTIDTLLTNQILSIAEYQAKVITASNNGIFSDYITSLPFIGFPASIANVSFRTVESFNKVFEEKVGVTLTGGVRKAIYGMYRVAKKPVKYAVNYDPIRDSITRMKEIDAFKLVINSGIFQSLKRELVTDTANGSYRKFYEQIRKASYVVDMAVRDLKEVIVSDIKTSHLYGEGSLIETKEATEKLVNTGVFKNIKEVIKAYYAHEDSIDNAIKAYEDKVLPKLTKGQIAHIEALEKYSVTGEAAILNQQTSVQNILNNMFQYHSGRKRTPYKYDEFKTLHDDIELLISLRILKDQDGLMSLVNLKQEARKELFELSDMYNVEYKSVQDISLNPNSYTTYSPLAFNYIEPDNDAVANRISLIPREKYEESRERTGLFSFANKIKASDSSIIIHGKEYIKIVRKVGDVGFEEQAIKLTNTDTRGLSVKTHLYLELANDIDLDESLDKESKIRKLQQIHDLIDVILRSQAQGKADGGSYLKLDGANVIPSYNVKGQIVDYILPHSKKEYVEDLDASLDIMSTLPHTISRLHSIKKANKNNKVVVDYIMDFYEKNIGKLDKDGNPLVRFTTVSNASSNPDAKAAWDLLPIGLKHYIQDEKGKGGLNVPTSMLDQIFGARDPSIVNLQWGKKQTFTDITTRDTLSNIESIWKEILAKNKSMLILLAPAIVVGNLVSNSSVAATEGISRFEFFTTFRNHWRLLNEYQDIKEKLTKLEVAKRKGEDVDGAITVVKSRLHKHPTHTLVNDGQFTPFVDDLDSTDDKGILASTYRNRVSLFKGTRDGDGGVEYQRELLNIQDKLKNNDPTLTDKQVALEAEDILTKGKLSRLVGKGIDTLFVNKGTPIHAFATKLTLYSDTITRQMILDHRNKESLKKTGKPLQGMELRSTLNELDMKLVNYTYLQNRYISWVDKVGGVHFLKYMLRSLKGYATTIHRDPIGVLNQQSLQYASGVDVADPLDSILRNPVDSLGNRVSDPVDKLFDIITPNVFVPVTEFDTNSFIKF